MKIENFIKGMKFLGIAYNKEFNKEQCEVWYDFFKNEDYEVFRKAIKRIISKSQYLPSISEIKKEMSLISVPTLQLNADEEWEKVLNAVRRYGSYRQEEAMNSLNEYTRDITRQVGYNRICMSEAIQWERKEFIELFESNKHIAEEICSMNKPYLTFSELLKLKKIDDIEEDRLLGE